MQCLLDVASRAGERQSHVRAAAHGVEVDARCDRNTGVVQQLRAERQRVRRQMRHVGVDVERAVGGRKAVDADLWQPVAVVVARLRSVVWMPEAGRRPTRRWCCGRSARPGWTTWPGRAAVLTLSANADCRTCPADMGSTRRQVGGRLQPTLGLRRRHGDARVPKSYTVGGSVTRHGSLGSDQWSGANQTYLVWFSGCGRARDGDGDERTARWRGTEGPFRRQRAS